MRMIKNTIEDAAVDVTEKGGAVLTVASSTFEVFDTAGASVQASASATITNNGTAKVTLSGLITSTAAGFVIDSDYDILFTYIIGTQTKKKRLDLHIGEETGSAISGNYISEDDVGNWPAGITDEDKLDVIERAEQEIERLTKDIFYEQPFDIFRDGNGRNSMALNLRGRILSVSAIYIGSVAMNTVNFSHDANTIHESVSGIGSDDFLKHELNRRALSAAGLFPEGLGNLQIVGTMGWPEKLIVDTVVGTFRARETITVGVSSFTAIVQRVTPTALWIVARSGAMADDDVVTGGTSAATAAVNNASGAVTDAPRAIKQAIAMLARFDNDGTLFSRYEQGSESIAGESYSNQRRPLTGIREIDRIINRFVRKIPRMAVV